MSYIFGLIDYNGVEYKIELNSRSSMFSFNMLARIKGNLPSGTMIRTLFLPEGISSIDKMAFNVIGEEIKTLYLPSTVTTINGQAFYGPLKLEYIFVCEDNTHFSSDINGVLFDKNKSILIRYPVGKNDDIYEIPQVKEIAPCAFSHTKIKFLSAPKSVSVIGEQAFMYSQIISADFSSESKIEALPKECFWGCSNLINISLPKCLKYIGSKCFCQCGFEQINLPDTIYKIEKYAFLSAKLKTFVMPRNVKILRMGIFQDCEQLETANINNVAKIHKTAFTNCSSLSEISANPHNRKFSTKGDGILYNKDLSKLLKVPAKHKFDDSGRYDIPCSVVSVDEAAFDSCVNLAEINFGNAILEDSAIFNCTSLKKITIGSECKKFSPEKVKLCFALEEISVAADNPYYKSVDGVLFDKSGERLILYPCAKNEKTYNVPDGVVNISDIAFYNANNLTDIYLPDSVKEIGRSAFELCKNLNRINLDKATKIGYAAFCCCESLDNISLNKTDVGNYVFAFCSSLESVNLNECQFFNNTFMLTPFNGKTVDYLNSNEDELSHMFIIANLPPNSILDPRRYFRKYWGM